MMKKVYKILVYLHGVSSLNPLFLFLQMFSIYVQMYVCTLTGFQALFLVFLMMYACFSEHDSVQTVVND